MSFRLAYVLGDLERTARSLTEIGETAREIEDHHRRMASTVGDCGSEDLSEATDDFLDAWSYGMRIRPASLGSSRPGDRCADRPRRPGHARAGRPAWRAGHGP